MLILPLLTKPSAFLAYLLTAPAAPIGAKIPVNIKPSIAPSAKSCKSSLVSRSPQARDIAASVAPPNSEPNNNSLPTDTTAAIPPIVPASIPMAIAAPVIPSAILPHAGIPVSVLPSLYEMPEPDIAPKKLLTDC